MSTEARCMVFCFVMGAQDAANPCERLLCLALGVCAHIFIILLLQNARRLSPFQLRPCRKGGNVATAVCHKREGAAPCACGCDQRSSVQVKPDER